MEQRSSEHTGGLSEGIGGLSPPRAPDPLEFVAWRTDRCSRRLVSSSRRPHPPSIHVAAVASYRACSPGNSRLRGLLDGHAAPGGAGSVRKTPVS